MSTAQQERPVPEPSWDEHYRDERDAAFLYRQLATAEKDSERRDLFERLAVVEDRHVARWEELFKEGGRPLPPYKTASRTRALAWIATRFGPRIVLPLILAEEGREVQAYLGLARVHCGIRRDVNGGLTANFGLVAGVIGADVAPHIVIISGVAGAIADALSMGASGYLAAKSEAEVQAHQIDLERHEMRLMPDLEEDELAVIYEAKGLPQDTARETARAMMRDPAQALEAMVREELNIHPAELAPLKDGVVTGTATAIGAFIPIVPFVMLPHQQAVWASLTLSMLAHFAIGAARSLFTGRGIWASGRDMFVVGFGVAAVGYVIGELITRLL